MGSAAAAAYGIDVQVRDFDVVPETSHENLQRLAAALVRLDARPHFVPSWSFSREECDAWTVDPATEENLDHLFETPHGLFDVVPWRAGRYEELAPNTTELDGVPVAGVDDLIRGLRLDKPKHQARLPQLEALKKRRGSRGSPA